MWKMFVIKVKQLTASPPGGGALTVASCRLQGRLAVETPWPGARLQSRLCRGPPTLLLRVRKVPEECFPSAGGSSRPRGSDCTGSRTRLEAQGG